MNGDLGRPGPIEPTTTDPDVTRPITTRPITTGPITTGPGATGRDIRVVLVDDQPLIRLGFRMVLDGATGIVVVGEGDDGAAGIALANELRPDVVVMDVRMPGTDGIQATDVIVRRHPGPDPSRR